MTDVTVQVPDEWVTAAAEAIRAHWGLPKAASWANVSSDARIALAAVLPLVERRLRDNIADEIEAVPNRGSYWAYNRGYFEGWDSGNKHAAAVARGVRDGAEQ